MTTNTDKAICEVCHRPFSIYYLPNHRRNVHGIRGGATGSPRRTRAERAAGLVTAPALSPGFAIEAVTTTATPTPKATPLTFKPTKFMVLEDSTGGMWLAEQIR